MPYGYDQQSPCLQIRALLSACVRASDHWESEE